MPSITLENNSTEIYDVASHNDFHVFSFKEKFFFYDINMMKAYEINESLYYKLNDNREDSDLFKRLLLSLRIKANNNPSNRRYSNGVETITLNVAQVCNLSCVYCYGVDGEYGTKGKMNEDVAFKSVDFLMDKSRDDVDVSIHFFGGEPLLNFPLIKKVVSYSLEQAQLRNKNIFFSITTNGTKFSDEVNAFLNKYDFGVTVSFDGDAKIQDKNRPFKNGKGSFSQTQPKIIQFLKSRNGKAGARATVTNHSEDLKGLKMSLKEMGFQSAGATVATLSSFAIENRPVDLLDSQQKMNLLLDSDNDTVNILKAIEEKDINTLVELNDSSVMGHIAGLLMKQKKYFPCGIGRGLLAISITGDIYPCHRFVGNDQFKMGHIDSYDGAEAEAYSASYTQTHPVCSNCWAKYQCGGGGCLHDNYITKGNVQNINTDHCSRLKNDLKNAIYLFSFLSADDKDFLFNSLKSGK